jgi:hypothetical protein
MTGRPARGDLVGIQNHGDWRLTMPGDGWQSRIGRDDLRIVAVRTHELWATACPAAESGFAESDRATRIASRKSEIHQAVRVNKERAK